MSGLLWTRIVLPLILGMRGPLCILSVSFEELIPEFFYLPEMLRNDSNFVLGTKQNGEPIGNVALPPWAADANDFIR